MPALWKQGRRRACGRALKNRPAKHKRGTLFMEQQSNQSVLLAARQAIDKIDGELGRLFVARMEEAAKVATYKAAHGLPVLDSAREEAVLARNLGRLPEDHPLRDYYRDFLQHNMALSRQYQARCLGRDQVAYQGVPGAFSHIALLRLFPHGQPLSLPTFSQVFAAVEEGRASYGVLPFENSQAGDVSEVLDLCMAHPSIYIVRTYDLPVTQNLLGIEGAALSSLRKVISHPQALRQCAPFLERLGVLIEPRANTALAAQEVAQAQDTSLAAIASVETAALYGLSILCPDISEARDNTTRFIVISREAPARGNRFSLLFTVQHKAGALARVVEAIGRAGYNMECIKSRPLPRTAWEYYFYTELVGEPTEALLSALREPCSTLRLLGRYERGNGHAD